MSSSAVTQKPQGQVAPQRQAQMEEKEASASANASAGLNLNIFGALSGAFSGKSKKQTQPDGSSTEHRDETAHVRGVGMGGAQAQGAASAEEKGRQMRQQILEGGK
ncbi:hypothetical protein H2203_000392 [Taxawa tesnikishii (nom. ined.)]|nr:hypothetical protein H2203_000392 [Dothideales sp. JES 119]